MTVGQEKDEPDKDIDNVDLQSVQNIIVAHEHGYFYFMDITCNYSQYTLLTNSGLF